MPADPQTVTPRRQKSRRALKQQLAEAFPSELKEIQKQKQIKKKLRRRSNLHESETTSNETSNLESRNSTMGAPRRKSLLIAKKHMPKSVKLDPNECIIQVTN